MNAKLKMISSMIAFGTISIFVKGIELSSKEIAFFRALIAIIFLGGVRICLEHNKVEGRKKIRKSNYIRLIISGVFIGLNWICLFEAYRYVPVSIATLCYYVQPILVLIFSAVLFQESMTKKQIACFVFSTIGLIFVLDLTGGRVDYRGIGLGLSAAVLYAMVVMINKGIKDIDDIEKTLLQFGGATIGVLPYIIITGGFDFGCLSVRGILLLGILGIVHTGICYCLYFSSISELTGQQVSMYGYVDPLVAILSSFFILQEKVTLIQALGGALILGATFVSELFANQKEVS